MGEIKYLVMDVDGTLTDGKIYIGNQGEIFKTFNVKDGYGIHEMLNEYDIKPVIITGRESLILINRCKELGIDMLYQGVADKKEKIRELFDDLSQVAYIGDDLNDLPAMLLLKQNGGIIGCPKDAVDSVKSIADYICRYKGGDGAVREFIEYIIEGESD